MQTADLKKFLDRNLPIEVDLSTVPSAGRHSGKMVKFWPFKFGGILIYGEVPGVKRLPNHWLIVPMSVLAKLCSAPLDKIKEHLDAATDLGLFESVEIYAGVALIKVAKTPWEMGLLD
jgi:hypothetical protein